MYFDELGLPYSYKGVFLKGILTYIFYNLNKEREPILSIFLRAEDKHRKRIDLTGFKPHFWVKAAWNLPYYISQLKEGYKFEKAQEKSVFGDDLYSLTYINPKETEVIRKTFSSNFEADIRFVWRYLIDKGIRSGVELVDDESRLKSVEVSNILPKVGYIDIECAQERVSTSGEDAVVVVSVLDSYTEKTQSFYLKHDRDVTVEDTVTFDDEAKMLSSVQKYLRQQDFDVITGWNIDGYDLKQLLNRCKKLHVPIILDWGLNKVGEAYFTTREIFDLLTHYRKLHLGDISSYSLGYVVKTELDKKKTEVGDRAIELWHNRPEEFIRINREHVALEREIDVQCGILDFYWTLKNLVGCRLSDTEYSSRMVDMLLLREAKKRCIVLPTRTEKDISGYEGARIFCEPGIYENVDVFDFTTMYPSIIKQWNVSPECKRFVDGKLSFTQEGRGIVPAILDILIEQRKRLQRRMNGLTGKERHRVDRKQESLKYITNAIYGTFGYNFSRLADRDCAAFVTEKGRTLLTMAEDFFIALETKPIAGDTDSVFVTGCKEPEIAEGSFNTVLDRLMREQTGKPSEIQLRHKPKLHFTHLLIKAKKHYAGLMSNGRLYVRGMGLVKSDTSKLVSDTQRKVLIMILKKEAGIREYLWSVICKIQLREYKWLEVARATRLTKSPDKYKTSLPHVRAAVYSNKHLNTNFKEGNKVMWCYVSGQDTDVIALDYGITVPVEYQYNTDKIITDLRLKTEKLLSFVGLTFPMPEKAKKQKGIGKSRHRQLDRLKQEVEREARAERKITDFLV